MASSLISNSVSNSNRSRDTSRRRKTKRTQGVKDGGGGDDRTHLRWKSQSQEQIYSSKLAQALRKVRISPSPSRSNHEARRCGKVVREAADRVLAVAAKGRTRWSRAILTNRLKLKFRKKNRRQQRVSALANTRAKKKPSVSVLRLKGKCLPAVQRKVRVLSRLVPGCRKEPLPVVLEEATDYIAALEMQVRAMKALTNLLSAAGSSSPPST